MEQVKIAVMGDDKLKFVVYSIRLSLADDVSDETLGLMVRTTIEDYRKKFEAEKVNDDGH